MFGSLSAVILSGVLNVMGKKKPEWTGNGKVDRFESGDALPLESRDKDKESVFNLSHFASGGILAVSLYLVGMLSHDLFGFPAPVMMLLLAVAVKLFRLAPANLENAPTACHASFQLL